MSPWSVVVMGGDSCTEGLGFEFQHHTLDGHFFTFCCCKNCNVCCKKLLSKLTDPSLTIHKFCSSLTA